LLTLGLSDEVRKTRKAWSLAGAFAPSAFFNFYFSSNSFFINCFPTNSKRLRHRLCIKSSRHSAAEFGALEYWTIPAHQSKSVPTVVVALR
jgi:hypothetical protein